MKNYYVTSYLWGTFVACYLFWAKWEEKEKTKNIEQENLKRWLDFNVSSFKQNDQLP